MEKLVYTVAEVAVLMGLSRQTVTRIFEEERGVIIGIKKDAPLFKLFRDYVVRQCNRVKTQPGRTATRLVLLPARDAHFGQPKEAKQRWWNANRKKE